MIPKLHKQKCSIIFWINLSLHLCNTLLIAKETKEMKEVNKCSLFHVKISKKKQSQPQDRRCMLKQKQMKPAVRPLDTKLVDYLCLEPFNIENDLNLLRDLLSWRKTNFYFVHHKIIFKLTTPIADDLWSGGQEWRHDWQHRGRKSVTDSVNSSQLKGNEENSN